MIMPKIFQKNHEQWFINFEKTGITNQMCRIVKVYCINSKGHLFEADLLTKPLNSLTHGIQYCGFLKQNKSLSDMIIVESNGRVDAMSKGIYDITGLTQDEFDNPQNKFKL